MKLLVIGGGGREHAIAWKLSQEPLVEAVYLAPGNAGIALDEKLVATGIAAGDFPGILSCVKERGVDFVVVGPDQALADGAVDFLEQNGVPAFGPTRLAAEIEWSKAFAKDLMKKAGIPTARFETFSSASQALEFLRSVEWGSGWVVKADGLALGKGVVVCPRREEALAAVPELMNGAAGARLVVEELLTGREVSAFFLCDGDRGVPLGLACDYKRIFDGNQGPNTGGMGTYSPADWVGEDFLARVEREVTNPLLDELRARGRPFKGILFIGLMVGERGIQVLEFNARFGDPETQVLLPRLAEPLLPWLTAARNGALRDLPPGGPRLKPEHAVHVVQAASGYPGTPRKGDAVEWDPSLLRTDGVKLFFAGVAKSGAGLVTSGGRVLGVTALGPTRAEARARAYAASERVRFAGAQKRSDIGL